MEYALMALTAGLSLDDAMSEEPGFVVDLYDKYCLIHGYKEKTERECD